MLSGVAHQGCARASKEQCKSVCAHVEGMRGKKLRRCERQCQSHGTADRAECLAAAGTSEELDRCRDR